MCRQIRNKRFGRVIELPEYDETRANSERTPLLRVPRCFRHAFTKEANLGDCIDSKRAKQASDMRSVYIHSWSKQTHVDDEPAWVNPFHGQVFGIYTIGDLNTEPTAFVVAPSQKVELNGIRIVCCQDEGELLKQFWAFYKANPPETLATYNGRKHAIPCLYWRSSVNGVEIANSDLLHDRYKRGPHVDLAEVLTYHGILRTPPLALVAANLGIAMPSLAEGDTVQQLILANLAAANGAMLQMLVKSGIEYARVISQIAAHCRKHLNATAYR